MKERQSEIQDLLVCPRCYYPFDWSDSSQLRCNECQQTFPILDGLIPIYDLYLDENPNDLGRDPSQKWDRDEFEEGYKFTGYHESGAQFDHCLGFPSEVSDFLYKRVKHRLVEMIQPGPNHRVLDVGCGAGYFLMLIWEKYRSQGFRPKIAGTDISMYQVSYMTQRMIKEGIENAIATHGNGEYLPYADNSFDLITCSEVIEHVRNPGRALEEMRRVLKPSGTLLLSTPSMKAQKTWSLMLAPFASVIKMLKGYKPDPDATPNAYDVPWYPAEFQQTIRNAGLKILDFEYNAIIPHPWHFKFLPKPLVKPTVKIFEVVDSVGKPLLHSLALHFVTRVVKN
jgi:ubiquinone/menaquinone biosynthesis C-methylase UbiE